MARLPRLTLPGYPHHVIQRGNNRQTIFASAADYQTLLDLLDENAEKFGVAVHAYVLMSNHFHLLATPQTAEGLPLMMQAVGRRYVRHFNDSQKRTGTLWEGRYKSTLIQTDRYLLACMAYIDLNPVRAALKRRRRESSAITATAQPKPGRFQVFDGASKVIVRAATSALSAAIGVCRAAGSMIKSACASSLTIMMSWRTQ